MSARISLDALPSRYQAQVTAQLSGGGGKAAPVSAENVIAAPAGRQRLRQKQGEKMNSNELRFGAYLRLQLPHAKLHPQAVTLGIANGTRYTPDWMSYEPMSGRLCFWEVKGTHKIFDGAGEKLKVAAAQYPEFIFTLVWHEDGEWLQQRIKA